MNINKFQSYLNKTQGKTIALIYIFENENALGYAHYDIWKSDVISEWLMAVYENKCKPLIFDIRTFVEKAMSNSLPKIDAVINLNNGNIELSTLSLVPSICSFIGVPCIPCNATSIISGENKFFSNCIAKQCDLNVPNEMNEGEQGIFRSINFGSSRGTFKTTNKTYQQNGFYQEFINGYDITTPLLYNPFTENLELLPTVLYYPKDKDISWFFNEQVKEARGGYNKGIVSIDGELEKCYKKIASSIQINTFCRIDARVKCTNSDSFDKMIQNPINYNDTYFVEINPMPTLKKNINIHNSLSSISRESKFYELYNLYNRSRSENSTPTGFILFCSLLSIL